MESSRINISSGAKWEDVVGYSRAVKIGNIIEVSGTTSADGEGVIGEGNAYLQAKTIIEKIENALKQAGASLNDVVRTRIYVTNISDWQKIAKAHAEFFSTIKPATSMLEVKALIDPRMLVEIEATAIITD